MEEMNDDMMMAMMQAIDNEEDLMVLRDENGTPVMDASGPIVVDKDYMRIRLGPNGAPLGVPGARELMIDPATGEPMSYQPDAADGGLSMDAIMGMLPTIEGFLWPDQEGNPVIMRAIAGDPEAVSMVQDKLGVFGMLASSGPDGLRDNAESLTQKGVDFVGGIISSMLGNIGVSDDGEPMDFPTEIDRSTGVIRILGEIGLFLQSFDNFAKKMAPNYNRPDNYMVELFLGNLDALMANVFSLMDMDIAPPAQDDN